MNRSQQQLLNLEEPIKSKPLGEQTSVEDRGTGNRDGNELNYLLLNQRKAFESSLNTIFPTSQEETKVQKARAVLGDTVKTVSDEELAIFLTQFEYLLDEWLDIYEQETFNGLTLQQVLLER